MGIGVALKRKKCFIELRKEHNKWQNLVEETQETFSTCISTFFSENNKFASLPKLEPSGTVSSMVITNRIIVSIMI